MSEVTHMKINKLCILGDERPCEEEHVSALYCHRHFFEEVEGLLYFTCDFRDSPASFCDELACLVVHCSSCFYGDRCEDVRLGYVIIIIIIFFVFFSPASTKPAGLKIIWLWENCLVEVGF